MWTTQSTIADAIGFKIESSSQVLQKKIYELTIISGTTLIKTGVWERSKENSCDFSIAVIVVQQFGRG